MKSTLFLVPFIPLTLAFPISFSSLFHPRQASSPIQATTDTLLFTDTLPQFETARNARNPPSLDWSSDGCTDSPDDPFGFNYLPACHRHDFGYQNYRAQGRFTVSNKKRIDDNFKKDLYYQCSMEKYVSTCKKLADVYYDAVREFGGQDASPGKKTRRMMAVEVEVEVEADLEAEMSVV